MRAALYVAPKQIVVREVPVPVPDKGEFLIQVSRASICGTDINIYLGTHPRARPPLVMGHEFGGRVVSAPEGLSYGVGDRVVVRPLLSCGHCPACREGRSHVCYNLRLIGIDVDGAFAEYVRVPADAVHPVPDALSDDLCALVEPLAVAVHAVRKSGIRIGDRVLVTGGGPVGCAVAVVAEEAGAHVLISEIQPFRVERLRAMGLRVVEPQQVNLCAEVKHLTAGRGVDLLFESSAAQGVLDTMADLIRADGKVVQVGIFKKPPVVPLQQLLFKEISITTVRVYEKADFDIAIAMMPAVQERLAHAISHRLSLEQTQIGLEAVLDGSNAMKILIDPQH